MKFDDKIYCQRFSQGHRNPVGKTLVGFDGAGLDSNDKYVLEHMLQETMHKLKKYTEQGLDVKRRARLQYRH